MRKLIDEYGYVYEIDEATLETPAAGGPTKTLYDQATGETFELPASLFAPAPQQGNGQQNRAAMFQRTPSYQERLVEILLEKCRISAPGLREQVELLVGPILSIGKISSKDEYHIVLLEIENLIRSLYMSNAISEEDSIYLMDQIEFFARWQLRRSITYDGKPNEREWWTIQSIHQKTEVRGEQSNDGGGILAAIGRAFGKGRY
jgi:hypothetical protein